MKFPLRHSIVLCALILFGIFFNRGQFSKLPDSNHAWAQIDRYALSLGFIDNNFNLFLPQTFVHNRQENAAPTTITGVDFPIHEYIIALITKLTGGSGITIFHWYFFAWSIAGLFCLYLLAYLLTESFLIAVLLTFIANVSPLFSFYQISYLTSVPALSSIIIGLYCYMKPVNSRTIAFLFFTLAALVRLTLIMPLIAVLIAEFFTVKRKKETLLTTIACVGVVLLYKFYNSYLASKYGTMFLTHLKPPESLALAKEYWSEIKENITPVLFSLQQYALLLISCIVSFFIFFRRNALETISGKFNFLFYVALLWTGANLLFFFSMMEQFIYHDYYLLDTFYLPFILLMIIAISGVVRLMPRWRTIFPVVLALVAYPSYIHAKDIRDKRLNTDPNDVTKLSIENFRSAAVLMDSLKIKKDAKVLVFSPAAPNLPFVLIHRNGYALLLNERKLFEAALKWPYDYVLFQNDYFVSDVYTHLPEIGKYLTPIASNGKITLLVRNTTGIDVGFKRLIDFNNTIEFKTFSADSSTTKWSGINKSNDELIVQGEYGPTFRDTISSEMNNLHVLVSADYPVRPYETDLVLSVDSAGKNFYYFSYKLNDFLKDPDTQSPFKNINVMYAVHLPHLKGKVVSWYIWNRGKENFICKNLKLEYY